jgi:hypothetical protein
MCHDYTRSIFNLTGRRGSVVFVLDSWKKRLAVLTNYSVCYFIPSRNALGHYPVVASG